MVRKCSYDTDSTECTTNCINKGRYCAVDSIDDTYSHKFQGWQVSYPYDCKILALYTMKTSILKSVGMMKAWWLNLSPTAETGLLRCGLH